MTTHPVVHWEIGARNADAIKAFYAELFGWTIQTFASADYSMVESGGNGGIGGGIMQNCGDVQPYLTVYVQVDDLEAMLQKAVALGGTACVPPTPIPNVGSFAMFLDPEKHVVGLLQPTMPRAGAPG